MSSEERSERFYRPAGAPIARTAPEEAGFKGLTYGISCACSWWRRLFGLHDEGKHAKHLIVPSRYAPGSMIGPSYEPIDYAELERAYEDAKWGTEEPSLGISNVRSMALLRASKTGETVEDARQWIIDHSDLVEMEGIGRVYRIKDEVGTMWMYP